MLCRCRLLSRLRCGTLLPRLRRRTLLPRLRRRALLPGLRRGSLLALRRSALLPLHGCRRYLLPALLCLGRLATQVP